MTPPPSTSSSTCSSHWPPRTRIVATDIVSTLDWPDPATNRHPALGRLTKELFDEAALHLSFSPDNYSRTTYLRDQLDQATTLSKEQHNLATTLAAGWEGTLDALLETTRTLYPSPA